MTRAEKENRSKANEVAKRWRRNDRFGHGKNELASKAVTNKQSLLMDSNQGLSASPPHGSKEPQAGGSVLLTARTTMASSQARNSKLPSAERKLFSAKLLTQPVPNQLLAKSRFTGKSTRNISLLRLDPQHDFKGGHSSHTFAVVYCEST